MVVPVGMMITEKDNLFMKMACDLACENVGQGGGPFGAVIVRDGEVIAAAGNTVTIDCDPTAHAVMNAIRRACSLTRDYKLDGCVAYCSCEPCPMCLSALYWAGVSRIYYGNAADDVGRFNKGYSFICKELEKPHLDRAIPCIHIEDATAHEAFDKWEAKKDRIEY